MQKQKENPETSVRLQNQKIKGHSDHYWLIVTSSTKRIQYSQFLSFAFYYLFEQWSDTSM